MPVNPDKQSGDSEFDTNGKNHTAGLSFSMFENTGGTTL